MPTPIPPTFKIWFNDNILRLCFKHASTEKLDYVNAHERCYGALTAQLLILVKTYKHAYIQIQDRNKETVTLNFDLHGSANITNTAQLKAVLWKYQEDELFQLHVAIVAYD